VSKRRVQRRALHRIERIAKRARENAGARAVFVLGVFTYDGKPFVVDATVGEMPERYVKSILAQIADDDTED